MLSFQMVNGSNNTASSSTAASEGASSSAAGSDEEPLLYVNARQYKRILKRRAARAKLHELGKIPKERPVSIHSVLSLFLTDFKKGGSSQFACIYFLYVFYMITVQYIICKNVLFFDTA